MASIQAMMLFLAFLLDVSLSAEMECGEGVPLCGMLTLQTGLGRGVYHSKAAKVHGLWPETGNYGTSRCIKPQSTAGPTKVYDCYSEPSHEHAMWFETHEWEKHGQCAGVKNVDDFFSQVCSLSSEPLKALEGAKEGGSDFESMVQVLRDQGYPVWSLDKWNDQIELSACAGYDGRWVLAKTSDMPAKCGGQPPSPPAPSPVPGPAPAGDTCVIGRKGPACSSNEDCAGLKGCVRCAHSGFCTDQPILRV